MSIAKCVTSGLSQNHLTDHRILAWLGLEGTLKDHIGRPLCNGHLQVDHRVFLHTCPPNINQTFMFAVQFSQNCLPPASFISCLLLNQIAETF